MNYKIEEHNIEDILKKLDLKLPNEITFFPENIDSVKNTNEFVFTESVIELNKYFELENLNVNFLGNDTELYRCRKCADIYLPAMFFSISAISQNPELVSASLNVISSFIYDALKGNIGKKTANIEFYFESKEKGKIKKINYTGDKEGLKNIEKIIKEAMK